jgi:transposase
MPQKRISKYKASQIFKLYAINGVNRTQIAKALKISRDTVANYIGYYEKSELTYMDLLLLNDIALVDMVYPIRISHTKQEKTDRLIVLFSEFHEKLSYKDTNLKQLWGKYIQEDPEGYKYSQFVYKYNEWCKKNNIKRTIPNKWKIEEIEQKDLKLLHEWRLSTDRGKWEKAVAILGLHKGGTLTDISKKIERSTKTIKRWIIVFTEKGILNIDLRRTKKNSDEVKEQKKRKSERIFKLLHESPSLHDINRTSWSLETLSKTYKVKYGESISKSTVSEYIRAKDYSFKKAKIVLTSPDPDYRKKLNNIKKILSGLKDNEKFFSIDEYGPFAIKIRGGRSYSPIDQLNTVPQYQISKGSLICTAALELSTNQITHFYSNKKNTTEMIKLLLILLESYKAEDRIYFSWDAASWHASKALNKKVAEVNRPEYRKINNTPFVELAPLPSSAQFLNVIESVFSGMARAIIHNSNYKSVNECKNAIDRYFTERNKAFMENPRRAGKKIWGEEIVKPIFKDSNTCKDPKYR